MSAQLTYLHDGALYLRVGDGAADAGVLNFARAAANGAIAIHFAGQQFEASSYQVSVNNGVLAHIFTAQAATKIIAVDVFLQPADHATTAGRLTAPMPGKVVSFAVKVGDAVTSGQTLAVMEAMKMEHTIAAPQDGTVAELLYAPGDQVAEGAALLTLAA
jgi:3-methylcrotonyl-CoA carboxylase alpha subunit